MSRSILAVLFVAAFATSDTLAQQQPAKRSDPAQSQLIRRAELDPAFLGTAVDSLARADAWESLDDLLSSSAVDDVDDETKAAIAETVGPAVMLRILRQESLGDSSREFLQTCRRAASELRRDEERLREAVSQLDSDDIDERLAGMRTLLDGGEASIAVLVDAIVSGDGSRHRDDQRRVLARLGPGGREALRQIALYGEPDPRASAVAALARLDAESSLADLLTAVHADDAIDAERDAASQALRRVLSGKPTRQAAIAWLARDLRETADAARRVENDGQPETVWTLADDGRSVTPIDSYQIVAAYRDGYDAAARLLRVGGLDSELAADALIADLNYRVLVDPQWAAVDPPQSFADQHSLDAPQLALAIDRALQSSAWPAVVGLLRMVDTVAAPEGTPDQAAVDRLLRFGGEPTPLVRAASAANPRVRYEATSVIRQLAADSLADGESFPGITSVRRTAAEMRSLRDRPSMWLVETRPDVTRRIETLFVRLGYDVKVFGSVRSLESQLRRGGDARLILAKTRLADATPVEMLDRVRRHSLGREIPIVFFSDSEPIRIDHRWDALTTSIPEPRTTAGLSPLLDAIDHRRRLPAMTGVDRRLYRDQMTEPF